jgi:hypothetical protein
MVCENRVLSKNPDVVNYIDFSLLSGSLRFARVATKHCDGVSQNNTSYFYDASFAIVVEGGENWQ